MLDGLTKVEDVTAILQTYDSTLAKVALSQAALAEKDKERVLQNLDTIKTQNLIHKANIQDIVDMAKLDAAKSRELKTRLNNAVAEEIEEKVLDTLTRTQLEEILNTTEIAAAKRQEILARYDNAAAAKSEAASIGGLGAAAKTAGAGLIGAAKGALGLITAHPFITAAAAIVAGFMIVKKINENILKDLEEKANESRDEYASLTSEVEDLESKLKDVQSRLKEINNVGAPELVDQDELKKLGAQNEELERELRIKQALKKMADAEAEDDAAALLNKKYPDWLSNFTGKIGQYNLDMQNRDAAKAEYARLLGMQQGGVTHVGENNTPIGILIASMENDLEYYESSLEEQARVIKEFYDWMQTDIIAAIGEEATTDEAKQILSAWNSFLELYDDMLAKSDFGVALPSSGSGGTAGDAEAVTAEKLNEKLASVIEKYKLLETLQDGIKNGGKISADSLSGIVEQFSGLDQSVADYHQGLITADELVRRVATAYQAAVNGYSDLGGKIDVEALLVDEDEVKTFSEQLEDIVGKYDLLHEAQESLSESGRLTSSTLASIVEKFPSMASSVDDYIIGIKSAGDLLGDLADAYKTDEKAWYESQKAKAYTSVEFCENLTDNQSTLIDELAEAYGVDLGNFKTVEEAKAKIQAEVLAQLATKYAKYANATTETLRKQLNALITSRRELLKNTRDNKFTFMDTITGEVDDEDNMLATITAEIDALIKTLEELDEISIDLDEIVFSSWDPEKFSTKWKAEKVDWFSDMEFKAELRLDGGDLNGATAIYQAAAKKAQGLLQDAFKSGMTLDDDWVQTLFSIIKKSSQEIQNVEDSKLSYLERQADTQKDAGDIKGAITTYTQLVGDVQGLIDQALKDGLPHDGERIQELTDKLNTYKKTLADLRLEEYDKLIEYNDKFDVWNQVDYTKLDKLKEKIAEINKQYITGMRDYQEWYEAFIDTYSKIYDIEKDAVESVLEETIAVIKKGYEDEIDAIESAADAKIESLEKEKSA